MRRTARLLASGLVGIAVLTFGACYRVWENSQTTPRFYRLALQETTQANAAHSLERRVLSLRCEPCRSQRWEATVTAEEINNWLAVELANRFPRALPRGVSEPRVAIHDNEAHVACRYGWSEIATTLSLRLHVALGEQPNVLAIRVRQAYAGATPIPLHQVHGYATHYASVHQVSVTWEDVRGEPVALIRLPSEPDAFGRRIWIETLELRDGEIRLTGRVENAALASSPDVVAQEASWAAIPGALPPPRG